MKLELIFYSETSVNIYLATGCLVTQDTIFAIHCPMKLELDLQLFSIANKMKGCNF